MTHYKRRTRGRYSSGASTYRYERARQHIADARRLTAELGGTDEDVKKYFFSLPPLELAKVLEAYEAKYGAKAKDYAAETIVKWRTGRVKMAGQTASRLFELLPPFMPLDAKYRLIENLWTHFGPASKKRIRIGLDADVDQVAAIARQHIDQTVTNYKIPDQLENRFTWLASGDSLVKQEILNHFRKAEGDLAVLSARQTVPVLMEHLRVDRDQRTHRAAQVLRIGKHELELLIDRNAAGVSLEDAAMPAFPAGASESPGWLWWVLATIAALALWIFLKSHR